MQFFKACSGAHKAENVYCCRCCRRLYAYELAAQSLKLLSPSTYGT